MSAILDGILAGAAAVWRALCAMCGALIIVALVGILLLVRRRFARRFGL